MIFNLLTSWPVSAWDEIHEVFGDGHDYDWALVDDEEPGYEEEQVKPEMKYQDVRRLNNHSVQILTLRTGLRAIRDPCTSLD